MTRDPHLATFAKSNMKIPNGENIIYSVEKGDECIVVNWLQIACQSSGKGPPQYQQVIPNQQTPDGNLVPLACILVPQNYTVVQIDRTNCFVTQVIDDSSTTGTQANDLMDIELTKFSRYSEITLHPLAKFSKNKSKCQIGHLQKIFNNRKVSGKKKSDHDATAGNGDNDRDNDLNLDNFDGANDDGMVMMSALHDQKCRVKYSRALGFDA